MEPATFWLVAQCLNQLSYRMPLTLLNGIINTLLYLMTLMQLQRLLRIGLNIIS
jgi:hypothetical protein